MNCDFINCKIQQCVNKFDYKFKCEVYRNATKYVCKCGCEFADHSPESCPKCKSANIISAEVEK